MLNTIKEYNPFLGDKERELLYRITNALLKLDDLNVILNKAAFEIVKATNACTVSIALYDQDEEKLVIEFIKRNNGLNIQPHKKEFAIGEGAAGMAAKTKEIVAIPDISKCKFFAGKCLSDAESLICIPMVMRDQLIGVINISTKEFDCLDEKSKVFLTILSTIIAIAVDNSRLLGRKKEEIELFNNVIENSDAGILVIGANGKIQIINDFFKSLFNFPKNLIGKPVEPLLTKRFGPTFTKKFIKELKSGKSEKFYQDVKLTFASEESYWLRLTVSFIVNNSGKTSNATILAHNITAEKNLIQAKNDLISTAAHELRTPLTAIKGYLSMIREGDAGELNAKQVKFLNIAYSSSERLVGLVEDLLSTLKIDEDRVTTNQEVFDVGEVIRESIESLSSKAEANRIHVFYNYSPCKVYGDMVRTKRVIDNLLDNAIKYTPSGGNVYIGTKNSTDNIEIFVKDTGVGIPREYSRVIFDKFVRINNKLSFKAGGTGLGLYIAKNIVEKQGGKIWFESKPKYGTTFFFTMLPARFINQ